MIPKTVIRIFLGALALAGFVVVWLQFRPLPKSLSPADFREAPPVATGSSMKSPSSGSEADIAAPFVAKMREWAKLTDSATADKIEIDLKAQITDKNAGAIVRALPAELLETPFGFAALERWAALDRVAAVEWLSQQQKPTPFQLGTALRGWTAKDREALRAYAADLPSGSWRERVLAEMSVDALHAQEPLESVALLCKMAPGETQTRLLKDSVALWAQSDPESASDWVSKVNDPALQRQLVHTTAIGYAFAEPKAATEWLQQSLPAGDELNQAMGDVVAVWTGDGKAADAAAWVAALPEGGMREVAVRKLIARWQEFNPGDAEAWVKTLPAGSLRQQAANALANPGTASR